MKPVGGILITLLTALPLYAQDNNEIVGQKYACCLGTYENAEFVA